jgi:hypothetical protein
MFRRNLFIIVFLVGVSLLISFPLSANNSRKPFDIYMIVWRGSSGVDAKTPVRAFRIISANGILTLILPCAMPRVIKNVCLALPGKL